MIFGRVHMKRFFDENTAGLQGALKLLTQLPTPRIGKNDQIPSTLAKVEISHMGDLGPDLQA